MNQSINGLTAPDQYTAASTIDTGQGMRRFVLDVVNQAIYWQAKINPNPRGTGAREIAGAQWQQEVQMIPGSRVISRPGLAGVRFRAVTPLASIPAGQSQAVVTVEAVFG